MPPSILWTTPVKLAADNGSAQNLFDAYLAGQGHDFDVSRIIKGSALSRGARCAWFELPSHLALVQIDIQLGEGTLASQF
jgi:hypothetical protein